jgi:hypothetical protein
MRLRCARASEARVQAAECSEKVEIWSQKVTRTRSTYLSIEKVDIEGEPMKKWYIRSHGLFPND